MALEINTTIKIRIVPNVHGSAAAACEAWLKRAVLGNPIHLSPNKIHVYGVYLRDWSAVNIEFTQDAITVMALKEQKHAR